MSFRVNLPGGGGIESGKQAVERRRASSLARRQAVAQRLVADRAFEESFKKGPQVEPSATRQDGQPSAAGDFGDGAASQASVFAGGEQFVRIQDVDEVVRNSTAFGKGKLRGADIEVPV